VRRVRPDQAAGLDLSAWRVAFNGAEPVHADTLRRFAARFAPCGFAAEATFPCYGMAEATVLISAPAPGAGALTRTVSRRALNAGRIGPPAADGDHRAIVSCGRALPGEAIAIVDPLASRRAAPDEVGEVWVRGPHVAAGYWRNPAETARTFGARIRGEGETAWLRTGDLGWIDAAGELYIVGRLKDVIVIRGTNVHPQDVERTVQASHRALRPHGGAAFGVEDEAGDEQLVVVQEVERGVRGTEAIDDIVGAVRAAVVREHELTIRALVLVPPGTVPKTSSGKIQRRLTRERWLAGALPPVSPFMDTLQSGPAAVPVAVRGEA
jgi:acyl-CoA synthetase (AMP-forming)/AMP-acid ligase II